MATPNSKASICNLALDYVLQDNRSPVTNIDSPTTPQEKILARWYDTTRRAVLRKKAWNFAIKRDTLTADATAPAYGYDVAFNLPPDFVRLLTIRDAESFDVGYETDYEVESNQILTNGATDSTLQIRYIWDFTNVGKMDALFIDLFAIELANRIAYKFTASNTDVQRLKALRDDKMAEAGAIDGQERPPRRIERSRARSGRRTRGNNTRDGAFFE